MFVQFYEFCYKGTFFVWLQVMLESCILTLILWPWCQVNECGKQNWISKNRKHFLQILYALHMTWFKVFFGLKICKLYYFKFIVFPFLKLCFNKLNGAETKEVESKLVWNKENVFNTKYPYMYINDKDHRCWHQKLLKFFALFCFRIEGL